MSKSRLVSDTLAGSMCAIMTIAYSGGFSTLIVGSALAPYYNLVIISALLSACVAILTLSFFSSFKFAMGGPDSNPSAILAVSVAGIVANFGELSPTKYKEIIPTVMAFLFILSISSGLVVYLVGKFKWGNYFRAIPYQVLGGFLGGTGCMLINGSWKMLMGVSLLETTHTLLMSVPALAWIFSVGVCSLLLIATKFWKHSLIIPAIILLAAGAFNLVLSLQHISYQQAVSENLLLQSIHLESWSNPFNLDYKFIRWDFILHHWSDCFALMLVVIISIVLNVSSLESVTGLDSDFDAELRSMGIANVLGGILGGIVSVNSFNRSLLNLKSGALTRWASRIAALIIILLVVLFPSLISRLPKPVLTGLLLYLGISLIVRWLFSVRNEMPVADFLILIFITVVISIFGIVPGVLIGIIITAGTFLVSLSKSPLINSRFSGHVRHSNVQRSRLELEQLALYGDHIQGATLQGNLFFGTASILYSEFKTIPQSAKIILFDFEKCTAIDLSSVNVLKKISRLSEEQGNQLIFTGLSSVLTNRIESCGLRLSGAYIAVYSDLDHGLEVAETKIINTSKLHNSFTDLMSELDSNEVKTLKSYFTECTVKSGEMLCKEGEISDELYFIVEGKVTVYVGKSNQKTNHRLRTYHDGAYLGEMGFFTNEIRSASLFAEVDTRLLRISKNEYDALRRENIKLASALQHCVIISLATRLRQANDALTLFT